MTIFNVQKKAHKVIQRHTNSLMEHKRVWRKHSKTDAWNHACCFKLQCFWRKNALKNECVRVRVKIFVVKREPTSACAPTCSICTSAPRDAATLQRQKNSQLRRPPVGRSVALIYVLTAYIRTCIQTQCALIHTYSQIFEGERRLNCCLLARYVFTQVYLHTYVRVYNLIWFWYLD